MSACGALTACRGGFPLDHCGNPTPSSCLITHAFFDTCMQPSKPLHKPQAADLPTPTLGQRRACPTCTPPYSSSRPPHHRTGQMPHLTRLGCPPPTPFTPHLPVELTPPVEQQEEDDTRLRACYSSLVVDKPTGQNGSQTHKQAHRGQGTHTHVEVHTTHTTDRRRLVS
jgi:hypothetical protein